MRRVEKETRETKRKRERDAKNTRRGMDGEGPAAAPSGGGSGDGSDDGPEYTADQLLDFESEASAIAAEFLAKFVQVLGSCSRKEKERSGPFGIM